MLKNGLLLNMYGVMQWSFWEYYKSISQLKNCQGCKL